MPNTIDLKTAFLKPMTPLHRQYESMRAIVVDESPAADVAKKYGYSVQSLYARIRDLRAGKIVFFPEIKRGPKKRQTPAEVIQSVLDYRKENLSAQNIQERLEQTGHVCSVRTVERILVDAQITKLPRRSLADRKVTQKNQIISDRSSRLDFESLKPFRYDCPVAGAFFFLPYLMESGVLEILEKCRLPKSSSIKAEQACLSMLLLKLMGSDRLSHMNDYDQESGLAVFAGLNFLPKKSYMSSYSCRTSEEVLQDFQLQLMTLFQKKYPDFYQSSFINLDFHSIPHFGEQSRMEKVWCGTRGKAIKGAHTLFAQDGESNVILYTQADILRKNESFEILKFVKYWKTIKKEVKETLVFDCKVTTYPIMDQLSKDDVLFITLRKRTKALVAQTEKIPEKEWQKVQVPIPKRKYQSCRVHVSEIKLPKCTRPVKQIIVTNHGRAQPTYIITNNMKLELKEILVVYAKRWHIENKFAELVSFFNLNALSSPLMIRIHFDILWTIIADTLYHRFSQDLPRFEQERADSLFRHFVNMPGQVVYDGKEFVIKIRKRAHTPILLGVKKLQQPIKVPWLNHLSLRIEWTA